MKSTRIYILSAPNAKAIQTLGLLSQMLLTIWLLSEMLLRKSRRRLFNFAVLHLQGRLCSTDWRRKGRSGTGVHLRKGQPM